MYWLDGEGAIWAATSDDHGSWKPADRIFGPGTARHDSPLAVLSRRADLVDLFWIGPGGEVMTSFFGKPGPSTTPDGDGWATPFGIDGGRRAEPGSGLAAVLQRGFTPPPEETPRMHVFWEGSGDVAQALVTTWWSPRPDGEPVAWSPPVVATPRATLLPGTDIAAAARAPDHVRVVFIDQQKTAAQIWWGVRP